MKNNSFIYSLSVKKFNQIYKYMKLKQTQNWVGNRGRNVQMSVPSCFNKIWLNLSELNPFRAASLKS